jgi:hypothetical protein
MRAGVAAVNRKTSFLRDANRFARAPLTSAAANAGSKMMSDASAGLAPTSTATTQETEPEVIAGIASGDLHPDQNLSIRADRGGGWGRTLLFLTAGIAAGCAIALVMRRSA